MLDKLNDSTSEDLYDRRLRERREEATRRKAEEAAG
jgi:hypothetical protein